MIKPYYLGDIFVSTRRRSARYYAIELFTHFRSLISVHSLPFTHFCSLSLFTRSQSVTCILSQQNKFNTPKHLVPTIPTILNCPLNNGYKKKFINIEILDFATFTQMLHIELQCNVGNMRGKNYLVYICIEIRIT